MRGVRSLAEFSSSRWPLLSIGVAAFALCSGCCDEKGQTAVTDRDASADAGTDEPKPRPTSDAGAPVTPQGLLPGLPRGTMISELTPEQADVVCDAYLDATSETASNLTQTCAVLSILQAEQLEDPSLREYRAACTRARIGCAASTATVDVVAMEQECGEPSSCSATLGEFDACSQEINVLNTVLTGPLSVADVPSCKDVTREQGAALGAQVITGILIAGLLGGVSPEAPEEFGANCRVVGEKCDGFVAPRVPDLGF